VIAECKVVMSGLNVLQQLDTYLELCRSSNQIPWRGHIVTAAGYTTELATAVRQRSEVDLWECRRDARGHPRLTRVT
jgi:hypothetical protein